MSAAKYAAITGKMKLTEMVNSNQSRLATVEVFTASVKKQIVLFVCLVGWLIFIRGHGIAKEKYISRKENYYDCFQASIPALAAWEIWMADAIPLTHSNFLIPTPIARRLVPVRNREMSVL